MKNLVSIVLTVLTVTGAQAKSGIDSVQLDYVALDPSIGCSRIFFQSSQHFKNTLFSVPKVVEGTGVEGARVYDLKQGPAAGQYTLALHLYFPATDRDLVTSNNASSRQERLAECNLDKVRNSINKTISDANSKIQTITPIPLSAIEVSIPGVKETGVYGQGAAVHEDVDVLDYYGKSITVFMKVSEAEKNLINSRLVSTGLFTNIRLKFKARSRSGSVRAQVDLNELATNFAAEAQAKGLKFLGSVDVKAILKNSMSSQSVKITSEGVSTSESVKVTEMILEKILKELNFDQLPTEKSAVDQVKAGSAPISVAAVIELLRQTKSTEFSFNMVSAPETASAQSQLRYKVDRLNDPNVVEAKLQAGYVDPSSGVELKKGQTISITPAYWYLDKIDYPEQRSYLTTTEIKTMNLQMHFEDIANESMRISDKEINNVLMAEGQWSPSAFSGLITSPVKHRWARVQRFAKRQRVSSGLFSSAQSKWAEIPVFLTFSQLGDRQFFKLSDMIQPNQNWKATYDETTGRLFVTALKDLGAIRLREKMQDKESLQYSAKPVSLDEVWQMKLKYFGGHQYSQQHVLAQDPKAITLQKTIVVFISLPKK